MGLRTRKSLGSNYLKASKHGTPGLGCNYRSRKLHTGSRERYTASPVSVFQTVSAMTAATTPESAPCPVPLATETLGRRKSCARNPLLPPLHCSWRCSPGGASCYVLDRLCPGFCGTRQRLMSRSDEHKGTSTSPLHIYAEMGKGTGPGSPECSRSSFPAIPHCLPLMHKNFGLKISGRD